MKRITVLFISFLALFYYFRPSEEQVGEIDIVQLKLSATKRAPSELAPKKAALPKITQLTETAPEESFVPKMDDEARVSDTPEDDLAYDDEQLSHEDEIPWDEIRSGWRSHLKDLLYDLDPENGEAIFSAYQAESNAFDAEMENLTQAQSGDMDMLLGQLENRHEEKLKEILGPYYREVTDHHQQYNSSIQYLNRSPNNYQVGVSL